MYPNVTRIPTKNTEIDKEGSNRSVKEGVPGEFDAALEKAQSQIADKGSGLAHVKEPLKFSAHALQRLKDRSITVDPELTQKLNGAVDKAAAKGIRESLVITEDGAWIVSVKNRTVITALDKGAIGGSVFTNIDGAVIAD